MYKCNGERITPPERTRARGEHAMSVYLLTVLRVALSYFFSARSPSLSPCLVECTWSCRCERRYDEAMANGRSAALSALSSVSALENTALNAEH